MTLLADEYNSIIYLQPDTIRNKGAIGYDMGTNEYAAPGNGSGA